MSLGLNFLAAGELFVFETARQPRKIEGLERAAAWHMVCTISEDGIMKTALVASLLLLAAISPASATSPTEVVQAAAEQVVQVTQDPALAGPAAAQRRRQEIQRIVETLFDLPEMTRR